MLTVFCCSSVKRMIQDLITEHHGPHIGIETDAINFLHSITEVIGYDIMTHCAALSVEDDRETDTVGKWRKRDLLLVLSAHHSLSSRYAGPEDIKKSARRALRLM